MDVTVYATDTSVERIRDAGEEQGAGVDQFDWNMLIDRLVHPVRVMIVEAIWCIGEPASPTDIFRMVPEPDRAGLSRSLIAYHARRLRECGVLTLSRTDATGRNVEKFYDLSTRS